MRYIQTNLLFRVFKKAFNVPVDWSNLRYFLFFQYFMVRGMSGTCLQGNDLDTYLCFYQ